MCRSGLSAVGVVEVGRPANHNLSSRACTSDPKPGHVAEAMATAMNRAVRQPSAQRTIRKAWWGVLLLFLAHGLVVASWISRIPAIQVALHLKNGILGLTLLSSAAGAVSTIPLSGYLVSRYGSKPISVLSGVGFCLSLVLPGLAFDALSLAAALFVYGV